VYQAAWLRLCMWWSRVVALRPLVARGACWRLVKERVAAFCRFPVPCSLGYLLVPYWCSLNPNISAFDESTPAVGGRAAASRLSRSSRSPRVFL
jgi:hypothetical protein